MSVNPDKLVQKAKKMQDFSLNNSHSLQARRADKSNLYKCKLLAAIYYYHLSIIKKKRKGLAETTQKKSSNRK